MPPKKQPTTPHPSTTLGESPAPLTSHKHANVPTEDLHEFGCLAFLEIVDPWDAKNTIHAFIKGKKVDGVGPLLREN